VGSWLADHGLAWRYLHDERGELVGLVCDVGYPGPDHLVVGCRGFLRAAITVTGTAGHSGSSTPVSGNAVEKAAELVHRLVRTKLPTVTPKAFPLPPKLTVTALHGGEASGG
jgi:succinyl-diaminopimelate desuccinylase